jgi:hypothetical protein
MISNDKFTFLLNAEQTLLHPSGEESLYFYQASHHQENEHYILDSNFRQHYWLLVFAGVRVYLSSTLPEDTLPASDLSECPGKETFCKNIQRNL